MKRYSFERLPTMGRNRSLANLPIFYEDDGKLSKYDTNKMFIGSTAFGYQMSITDEFSKSTFKARTFAENNLVNCECLEILCTMYTQMIDHSQESGTFKIINLISLFVFCIHLCYSRE